MQLTPQLQKQIRVKTGQPVAAVDGDMAAPA
jgi:hypothetical protein